MKPRKKLLQTDTDKLLDLLCKKIGVSVDEVKASKDNKQKTLWPKQLACYYLSKHKRASIYDIAEYFKKDRTTIHVKNRSINQTREVDHCFNKIMEDMDKDVEILFTPELTKKEIFIYISELELVDLRLRVKELEKRCWDLQMQIANN
jgi:hypothetical protein